MGILVKACILVLLCGCRATQHKASLVEASSTEAVPASATPSCIDPAVVTRVSECIDQATKSPWQCFVDVAGERAPCDQDQDGLDDQFEAALARSYVFAVAFNAQGPAETCWPGNVQQFVQQSLLLYSPSGSTSLGSEAKTGYAVVNELPQLNGLDVEKALVSGGERLANDPKQYQGPNFWLCQKKAYNPPKYGGMLGADEKLATSERSINVPGGVHAYMIVHPVNQGPLPKAQDHVQTPRYVLVATEIFYPYNQRPFDNHEGDWEGGGVFVDTQDPHGAVIGAYFDRHPTTDHLQLTMLGQDVEAIDPGSESGGAMQCSNVGKGVAGLRFWDFDGPRHHVVIYPAAGGHATYGYPGVTKIFGIGCSENAPEANDTHHGDGLKLLPWLGIFAEHWGDHTGVAVRDGVELVNLGEELTPLVSWAAYRGQWGCQDGLEGKLASSWPGPFGNHRHCRGWLRHDWHASPPFSPPSAAVDCVGL